MIYDLAIIGGGPAGYAAAFEAVKYNMAVALFEKEDVGGTCLNRGCVPTKYLTHIARKYYEAKYKQNDGILFQGVEIDFNGTSMRMNNIIHTLRDRIEKQFYKDGIQIVKGNACIQDKGIVECNGGE